MDEVTRKWFDPSTVKVMRSPELEGWRTDAELARLSGAPRDSRLEVTVLDGGAIQLKAINDRLLEEPLVRLVRQEADGYVFQILNASFVLQAEFRFLGIGPRSVAIELLEAKSFGSISKVIVHAVGDRSTWTGSNAMNGYYVWPLIGFNAPLPERLREHPELPSCCRGIETMAGLMSTCEGERFWLEHGESIRLEFSLADGSESWTRFHHYVGQRNIRVTA
ncbi:hypothetical protein [Roseateles sp.]|uniref:hypothetical protein n=1 Tax=Roseateles sp. TaxID=1971397 RepID=UPI0031DB7CF9